MELAPHQAERLAPDPRPVVAHPGDLHELGFDLAGSSLRTLLFRSLQRVLFGSGLALVRVSDQVIVEVLAVRVPQVGLAEAMVRGADNQQFSRTDRRQGRTLVEQPVRASEIRRTHPSPAVESRHVPEPGRP